MRISIFDSGYGGLIPTAMMAQALHCMSCIDIDGKNAHSPRSVQLGELGVGANQINPSLSANQTT